MRLRRRRQVRYELFDALGETVVAVIDLGAPLERIDIIQPVRMTLGETSHTFVLKNLSLRRVR